jgi:hypothetical protein
MTPRTTSSCLKHEPSRLVLICSNFGSTQLRIVPAVSLQTGMGCSEDLKIHEIHSLKLDLPR